MVFCTSSICLLHDYDTPISFEDLMLNQYKTFYLSDFEEYKQNISYSHLRFTAPKGDPLGCATPEYIRTSQKTLT